jgi:hypothetical protein
MANLKPLVSNCQPKDGEKIYRIAVPRNIHPRSSSHRFAGIGQRESRIYAETVSIVFFPPMRAVPAANLAYRIAS